MTAYYMYIPNDTFTGNDVLLYKNKVCLPTLYIAVFFQLIVYANIKNTKRYYRTSLWVGQAAKKKNKLA